MSIIESNNIEESAMKILSDQKEDVEKPHNDGSAKPCEIPNVTLNLKENERDSSESERKRKRTKEDDESDRKAREEDKKRKNVEKEEEKEMKRRILIDKKLERERKKENERIEREKKKEEDKLEREKRKEEERSDRERKREEERQKKNNEREEKERQRLEKKKKVQEDKDRKEQERKRVEEEKKRAEEVKERSQKKISSFFSVGQKQSKLSSVNLEKSGSEKKLNTADRSAYDEIMLPFHVKSNVRMATTRSLPPHKLEEKKGILDRCIQNAINSPSASDDLVDFFKLNNGSRPIKNYTTPQDVIEGLNSSTSTEIQIYEMLRNLGTIKYLQFYENLKPPYVGTWCSKDHISVDLPLENPSTTTVAGLNYEYDSDIEWSGDNAEEEGEGEDIDEDDEDDDEEEEDDNEMADFVETNEMGKKNKKYVGPLVSISKWNDGHEPKFFDKMKIKMIGVDIAFPIDPLKSDGVSNNGKNEKSDGDTITAAFDSKNNIQFKEGSSPLDQATSQANILTPKKQCIEDPEAVHELVNFIEKNKDYTIGTLVELFQKEFSQFTFTKAVLKHTIQKIAFYDKKNGNWVIKEELKKIG